MIYIQRKSTLLVSLKELNKCPSIPIFLLSRDTDTYTSTSTHKHNYRNTHTPAGTHTHTRRHTHTHTHTNNTSDSHFLTTCLPFVIIVNKAYLFVLSFLLSKRLNKSNAIHRKKEWKILNALTFVRNGGSKKTTIKKGILICTFFSSQ